ncbi:transglycosylase domain-containing protein [Brachybacterium alimentarium]|uniref:transglycosylase domain-containing protein n=1 Tax=Brachybacterium alimentarium TaxID=47845 RepID=UPI003FD0D583
MSDSRRDGARRAAGVRRTSSAKSAGRSSRTPAPKSASRTPKKSGAATAGASASASKGASRTSVNSRHAGSTGKRGGTQKVAATNFLNYPRAGRKNPWRWIPSLRMIVGAMALMVLAGLGFAVWLYNDTAVPEPSDFALAQTSRVYYADGETEMGTFSEINRTELESDEIPQNVKDAVVASEDSTFYENRGVSPRGIVRALVNNLQGGARQGGSTITMQYVERYYTGTETSYVGKAKEAIMALKIDQELEKDEILSRYLNTIYFGRGAYGVQEASQAYFGKDAADMNDAEAALLVAVIPGPSSYDPANNEEKAVELWGRVISREVNVGEMSPEDADALEFPETIEPKSENSLGGTKGYLLDQVRNELVDEGFTEDEINTGGFTIVSTIDTGIQDNTIEAIKNLPEDRPENNHVGTVTIDPSSGAIRALYGGEDFVAQPRNDATQSRMQAGSIFKTFTLIAALEDGYPLDSYWDGNSPKSFPGWTVNNFNNTDYGRVSLRKATESSINTAYSELNLEIGPERTRDTAVTLGLPEKTPGLSADASNVLGSASPTVAEMGEVYATIAADGVHRDSFIVESVTRPDGSSRYEHKSEEKQAMDKNVAINATVALQGPPTTGSARSLQNAMGGRPVAGKTGTSEKFRSAWFVGFTPQLVTAVGMFQPSEDGTTEESLTPFGGVTSMTGGSYPTTIWGDIMSKSLEGQEMLQFPGEVPLDNETRERSAPSPEPPAPKTTQAPAPEEPSEEPSEEETTEEEEPSEEPSEEETTEEEEPSEEETTTEEEEPSDEPTEEKTSDKPTTDGGEDSTEGSDGESSGDGADDGGDDNTDDSGDDGGNTGDEDGDNEALAPNNRAAPGREDDA